jgi:hypothetical protein
LKSTAGQFLDCHIANGYDDMITLCTNVKHGGRLKNDGYYKQWLADTYIPLVLNIHAYDVGKRYFSLHVFRYIVPMICNHRQILPRKSLGLGLGLGGRSIEKSYA